MPELGPAERLLRLENAGGTADGQHVNFDLVTKDGRSHRFWMGATDIAKFVSYLIGLSQFLAGKGTGLQLPQQNVPLQTDPIEAVSIGIAPGRTDQEILLAIHTGTMVLSFASTQRELSALRDVLSQTLCPMTADTSQQN